MFLSLIFLVTRMIFTLLGLEAVCNDSCWSPPPCSLTSCNWPSGCCTVGCPSKTLIPESLVASSSSSCSYSYIIINNTYYSWTTWEFRLGTNGFSASKLHFTIKSYLFIWPCLWKNSKQYYDKFVNHWQSQKYYAIELLLAYAYVTRTVAWENSQHFETWWSRHHWFPCKIMSEKRVQQFHTDDASLSRPG